MKLKSHRLFRRFTFYSWALPVLACLVNPFIIEAGTITEDKRMSAEADEQRSARKVIDSVATAWNKNDTETIAKLFLPDAVLITPTGSVVQSQSAIRKRIMDERSGKLKDTTLRNSVQAVSLPNSNTAVVKGQYQLNGMKILGVESNPEGSFVLHQKKQQGRWMIAKAEILRKKED